MHEPDDASGESPLPGSRQPRRLRTLVAFAAAVPVALLFLFPDVAARLGRNLLALWSAVLFLACALTLTFFVYRVFLRKALRARRIANLRMKRWLDESK